MASYSYKTDARVTVLRAQAQADATAEVVRRVAADVRAGSAQGVLVLAPSATAADAVRRRLGRELGDGVEDVRVATPRAVALQLLDCEAAFAATGRRARVLAGFELAFVNEDRGTLGVRGRRVRELVKFLERGWSELREVDDDWLVTGEEMAFETFLKDELGLLQALHPAEVEAACVRYLAGSSDALEAARARRVYVCDARAMSRAAQILACLLAAEGLTIAWDEVASLAGEDPYAYDGGLDELLAANAGATVEELTRADVSAAVAGVLDRLRAARDGGAGSAAVDPAATVACCPAPAGAFEVVDAGTLAAEMDAVVAAVRARLDAGVDPRDVFVATPNDAWTRRVRAALEAAGIACTAVEGRQALACDVRDAGKSAAARTLTALELVADPDSATAWRCWCGYGDYLANSGAVARLVSVAREHGTGLVAELAALDEAGEDAELARRYRAGRALIEGAQGLLGNELLAYVGSIATGEARVPAQLSGLLGGMAEDEDAAHLHRRATDVLLAPRFADAGVRVGSWDRLLGGAPQTVVFCGMVNGLVPDRSYFDLTQLSIDGRAKMRAKLVGNLVAATSHAACDLVCTTFSECGLVDAETLKLDTERIRLVEGARMARISQSAAIALLRGEE